MPDVVLFGATGYTGRLTARALARRGADFAVAGRDPAKLARIADETGATATHRVAVGDVDALVRALDGARVLVTCVGPFTTLGDTAAEAAVRAGVHYVDSTGEGEFVARLLDRYDERARAAGIAMAPALGFDEVPADVAATIAAAGIDDAALTLTYALPSHASAGTIRSALGIVASEGRALRAGRPVPVRAAQRLRWAPLPAPLGVRAAMTFPLSSGYVVPLHLPLRSLETYVTTTRARRALAAVGVPVLRAVRARAAGRAALDRLVARAPDGPGDDARARSRWTILAEARGPRAWRNVVATGTDPYGLTAETLARGALEMARPGFAHAGVVAPVQALGLDVAERTLAPAGVVIDVLGAPRHDARGEEHGRSSSLREGHRP
ncbi:MAG TPA: saccharopine dehydrogenase NADP-binding domain-containing protein [Actinomycetota bacterium]|nr:saccharopine dehydrogenase NADP-binding domain-containing protein [Actinomycetota bacterium]